MNECFFLVPISLVVRHKVPLNKWVVQRCAGW